MLYHFIHQCNLKSPHLVSFVILQCTILCLSFIFLGVVFQISVAARDVVTVSPAGPYRGVERDSAVSVTGFGCAGVYHLSPTAGEWFSQCHLQTMLLQAGV